MTVFENFLPRTLFVGIDNQNISGLTEQRRTTVGANFPGVAGKNVGGKALTIAKIDHIHLFKGQNTDPLNQFSIDSDTADIIDVSLADAHSMEFGVH